MGFSFPNNGDRVQQWLGALWVSLSAGLSCGWWAWNTGGTKEGAGGRGDRGGSAAISHCLLTSGGLKPAVWGPPDRP